MSEFGIPAKLIRLCKMTLKNAKCVEKGGHYLSENFDVKRRFRQDDSLSCDFLMERIIITFIKVSCLWCRLMMLTSLAEVSAKLKPLSLSSLRKRGILLRQ